MNGVSNFKGMARIRETAGRLWTETGTAVRHADRHKLISAILLFIVLEIAVLSIERAQWITPQPLLTLVLIVAMFFTWFIETRARIHGVLKHAAIMITGGLVILWQVTSVANFGQATIYFTIFLVLLVWLIGYISTWYFMRKRNAWVAVILGAIAILVNLSNLPDNYYYFFVFYFLTAILFIVRNRISRYDYQAASNPVNRKRGLRYFMTAMIGVSVLAVVLSWALPVVQAATLENWIAKNTQWSKDLEKSSFNFFMYVMAKQPRATSSSRRYLGLGSGWHQNDNIHFIVESERPAYWQVYVYDEYTSQGWVNSPLNSQSIDKNARWESAVQYAEQSKITNKVQAGLKTDILLTAGEFVSSDTSVFVHETGGEVFTVTTPRLLKPGESYEITSYISSATSSQLATAGENYPQSITERYLQLPDEFPDSVRAISVNVTRDATTPYERVMAIDRYLAGFPYEKEIEPAPVDVDSVEYFLTVQKSGFCTYFASAMVVMLRSVDIPARLVVGYLPGEMGPEGGEFILRDRHYHAWPQVYFPGYGWINIEATPAAASGPVNVEVPLETSPTTASPRSGQTTPIQWWEIPYWPDYQVEPPSSGASQAIFKDPRWSFADALGKALLALAIAALVTLFIAAILYAFRSSFYRWLWKVVRTDPARNVYSRLCSLGTLVKIGPKPSQTPLEYAAVLAAEFPEQAEEFRAIINKYMDNHFGRKDRKLNLMEEAELLSMRRDVYNAMLKRTGFFSKIFRRPL